MKKRNLIITMMVLFSAFLFVQCSKDDGPEVEKGQVSVKITDAPSDDANIQGTFITVSDVKIDGESVEGFTSQTIEISAYQNGEAKLLVNEEIEAKAYNSVTLVLDSETDESGNSPGCYVLTEDNAKHELYAGAESESEINFSKTFDVTSGMETSLVIDFDLRKTIVRDEESEGNDYTFVTTAELNNSVRIVNEEASGEISGSVSNSFSSDDEETYIFVYPKGEFEASSESSGSGESNVLFANAVTSAKVESDGNYTLSFLEEGDYEVHVASYGKSSTSNKFEFKGMLDASSAINGLMLTDISVSANSNVELDIGISGFLN